MAHRQLRGIVPRIARLRGPWVAALTVLLGCAVVAGGPLSVRAPQADETTLSGGGAGPRRAAPELRELERWLRRKAEGQLAAMPTEARLAYRRGRIAWSAGQDAEAVSLLRGAAELDPSFVAPHLTLACWFLTREPSQALLSWASLLHRLRGDFTLQLELAANAVFFALHALFFALLSAAVILVGLRQHELRHLWRERLGIALSPLSAGMWSWAFLVLPWTLGLGLVLPALVMLAMLWPMLRARERFVFVALAAVVGLAPLSSAVMGRLALPLRDRGAPFHGVTALDKEGYSPERYQQIAALAREHRDSPYLQFALGWMARRAGDLGTAENAYRRVLELWPSNDRALNNLGNLKAMQGRFDEAIESFRKAAGIDPRSAEAYFNASQVHTRLFDYRAASDAVARASALDFELVRSYQARSGEHGDLPLADQWIAPTTFWTTLLRSPAADVVPALPAVWSRMIEASGWPFAGSSLALTLVGLAMGLLWQQRMPLRSCSNCARPVCRRCAQRMREVALCPECATIAARAESGEFGRVLLLQQRRRVDQVRTVLRTGAATLVPGLGLLARRRVFTALGLLMVTAMLVSRWLDLRAPFALADQLGPGSAGVGWAIVVGWVLVYGVSLLGYFGTAPETEGHPVPTPSAGRSSPLSDTSARAA